MLRTAVGQKSRTEKEYKNQGGHHLIYNIKKLRSVGSITGSETSSPIGPRVSVLSSVR